MWSMLPVMRLPWVMVLVEGSCLLMCPNFCFSYFCRCQSALADKRWRISGEVILNVGQWGGGLIMMFAPIVV